MNTIFNLFLILHILGGIIGLFFGTVNLLRKKGDKKHKTIGKIFVYSMFATGFSALIISVIHPNYFLFMVGIFTLYMIGSGNRYLYLKQLGNNQKPKLLDWTITIVMFFSGLFFIVLGVWFLAKQNYFGLVFTLFGLLSELFVREDFRNYKGLSKLENYWLVAHIGRMTGAYISSLTAFLVVNWKYTHINLPSFLVWMLPSIIIVPFIIRWSRKYEVKKTR
jgi:uncharacterized membrane protein